MAYLNGGDNLKPILGRVEKSGGKIVIPKTEITPEIGCFSVFEDTEGNHVALHSKG
jgi:predicted enzyme related to lactoylglutathione lyase